MTPLHLHSGQRNSGKDRLFAPNWSGAKALRISPPVRTNLLPDSIVAAII
jgi:hypothetical protein